MYNYTKLQKKKYDKGWDILASKVHILLKI